MELWYLDLVPDFDYFELMPRFTAMDEETQKDFLFTLLGLLNQTAEEIRLLKSEEHKTLSAIYHRRMEMLSGFFVENDEILERFGISTLKVCRELARQNRKEYEDDAPKA